MDATKAAEALQGDLGAMSADDRDYYLEEAGLTAAEARAVREAWGKAVVARADAAARRPG